MGVRGVSRLILLALVSVLAARAVPAGSVEVTYLGNEGFLLDGGGKRVVVDALHGEGLRGYVALTPGPREKLEAGAEPFDEIDLVLATHHHGDHFDPLAVGRHLTRNPKAHFVSTPQAVAELQERFEGFDTIAGRVHGLYPPEGEPRRVEHGGVPLTVLRLHHGRDRPVENLGFIVELAGLRLLHIGDTEAVVEDFRRYPVLEETLDVAFVPSWYFRWPKWRPALEQAIRARHLVGMHLPAPDAPADYFRPLAGLDAVLELIEGYSDGTHCFRKLLETRTFTGTEP